MATGVPIVTRPIRALVGYERSGVVRRALRARGVDAWSSDLQAAADGSPFHEVSDARELGDCGAWDVAIVHPPCTYLCGSGLHWNGRRPGRADATAAALEVVKWWLALPDTYRERRHQTLRVCLENPVGLIGTAIRKADQWIQPYQFGDDASKRTGLWLVGLPPLRIPDRSTWRPARFYCQRCGTTKPGKPGEDRPKPCECGDTRRPRWGNQTDSGQNRLGPSPTRADMRAETYPGIAEAMAAQWVPFIHSQIGGAS